MAFDPQAFASQVSRTTTQNAGFDTDAFLGKLGIQKKVDLDSVEGLAALARQSGFEKQAEEILGQKDKLSVLQRLGRGLGAFNPAQAISVGQEEGLGAGLFEYPKSIVTGLGSAITGKDLEPDRKFFADIVEEAGIENGIAKFGLGFAGDVLLDPSTYFGGAIAKGLLKGTKAISNVGLKTVGKIAPDVEIGLRTVGAGLQDSVGKAFQFAYKSSKGAKEDVLSFLTKEQTAKLGLAESNLSRLGTGTLSPDQSKELALKMIAGKRAEFVAREAGETVEEAGRIARQTTLQGTTPVVRDIIKSQIDRGKGFAKTAGIENTYETYFPFLNKNKVNQFLRNTKGIKVGSEPYRKQFKNLLTNENMELNPAKAFFTSESQIVSDKLRRNFLSNFVKRYGKNLDEFTNSDEAASQGFQLLREKGIFGKELGYVPEFDAKLIRDSLDPGYQAIDMIAKATGFDALTSLFKRSVTGLFAPFHVRNYASGVMQNFEVLGAAALNPRNMAIGQKIAYLMGKGAKMPDNLITVGGKEQRFSKLMKPFVERFSGDTFYTADFDLALKGGDELKQVAKTFSKQRLKETIKTAGLGQEATPFKIGRAVGQFIEHQQKATAYITALNQGRGVKEALRIAEAAGFDYRALTRFESQIMRRLIPFYSFTRKNIDLQLKTLGENPQRINQIMKFFENVGAGFGGTLTEEERKVLPDFIRESLGIRLGDTPEGLKQYISSFGTPIEAFTQLFSGNKTLRTISMTNPLLKVPIELGIGKDTFRQRDLKDVYTANEYEMAPQIIKDLLEIKEITRPVYKTINGKPTVVGEKKAFIADPERLLVARSLFTSRGVSYLDQVFGDDMNGLIKVLKTTTGIKPQQLDIEQQRFFTERDKQRAFEDLLNRFGIVKKFEKTFIPKN